MCPTRSFPDIDEDPRKGELPRPYAARLAREKARAVQAGPEDAVICADTTVALGRRILGVRRMRARPRLPDPARRAAPSGDHRRRSAQGRQGLGTGKRQRSEDEALSDDELNAYLASGEWQGKAGGYGIQALAGAFIPWISDRSLGSWARRWPRPRPCCRRRLAGLEAGMKGRVSARSIGDCPAAALLVDGRLEDLCIDLRTSPSPARSTAP